MTNQNSERKRGAQLGNINAFKHGFYSEAFKRREHELLSSGELTDLEDEKKLLRIIIKRSADKMKDESGLTFDDHLSALRTISFAVAVLERLQRSNRASLVSHDQEDGFE